MQLHWLGVSALTDGFRRGDFSPVDVVQHLLERIKRYNGALHAYLRVDDAAALAQARIAEKAWHQDKVRSMLEGVPFATKDLLDVAGEVTTCHSKLMLDRRATQTAVVLKNLQAAGAISMGRLALHEFAFGGPAFDLPFPPARNPWNLRHHPGGSSSGSGVALAAGLVPLAIGTDTGGSIRNPAGACGIAGLKATYEAVSRQGAIPLSFSLDHVGPMARSVRDIAYMLDMLKGVALVHSGESLSARLDVGIKGLRIGFVRHFHEEDLQADAQTRDALAESARQFRELGAIVQDVRLPSLETFNQPQKTILWSEAWTIHRHWLTTRPEDYCATSRRKLLPGAFLTAAEYIGALQKRQQLRCAVDQVLEDVDMLLVANSMEPPCLIDDADEAARTYTRQARSPFNLTGHPALALPNGFSDAGLPLSMQLVGRWHDEATLLRAGAAYEGVTDWHKRHPEDFA